jgi:glucose uptake protein GlcU
MDLKNYKPLLYILFFAAAAYLVHKMIFSALKIEEEHFYYSLETLYVLFFALSISIMFVILKVKERSFDNVGMSFLLATSIKLIVSGIILKPLLQLSNQIDTIQKKNFFAIFILFLAMETILTIRLLNKKE